MRLFIAVNLPAATRDAIYADTARLRSATTSVKWVAVPSLHVTLKFLGEQDERLVAEFENALRTVAAQHEPILVHTTALGTFPNFRHPRVVWVGMTGETELRAIARGIDQRFAGLGVPEDSREFRAHLTLGRVKGEMPSTESSSLAAAARTPTPAREFVIRTIDLMRSELGPGGSRYSVLAAVPLHARGT